VPGSLLVTFVRFVATGVTASVSYGLLFLVMGALTDAPDLMLNLVATVRTTGRGSVARGQSAGSGMAVIGLLVNSLALANGTFWFPMPWA